MLIFNCSRAFAEFIEPKPKADVPPLVQTPPSPSLADDAELLRDRAGEKPAYLQQWVAHLVRIRRKPCVLVMEANTRYAMVFPGLKKGDVAGFINQVIERLANEMTFAVGDLSMMADFDVTMAQFLARHRDFRFFLRMDRSVQAHLKDAAWYLEDWIVEANRLPEGHEECAMVDERVNRTIRSTKSHKDYFVPAEEMLIDWLTSYAGLTAQGEAKLRAQIRENKRRVMPNEVPIVNAKAANDHG